ncbi:MAG: thiol:disulfide interchange protein DsbA/DsbL [Steroidobacteraceae bacterium]|jgi:thiol:disulfide interchange protein DsbA|nr:thiol:disulfide interchange protein DsbA/DsbL [Steroidobacteraceae bacterium]
MTKLRPSSHGSAGRVAVALAGVLLGTMLAACGQKAAETPAPVADAPAPAAAEAPAATPAPATPATAAAIADGETVGGGNETTLLSPIATAVAQAAPAAAPAIPARWQNGRHYETLMPAQPTNVGPGKVEVLEMFWYGCGHCFHLDPFLEGWKKQSKPAFVEFTRVPVMWNDVTRAHARLFYTAEALGKLEQVHAAIFREIHVGADGRINPLVDRDPARTEQLHRAFLKKHGVSDADFDRTYRSFAVDTKLQRAEQLTRRYRVQGVPLMIVAGKYTADAGTAGGEQPLLALINDLANAERRR